MKKLMISLVLASCGVYFASIAHASYSAGCTLIAEVVRAHGSCSHKTPPAKKQAAPCQLKLKIIAIGNQRGLGQNFCTQKGFLGRTFRVVTVKPGLIKRPAFTTGWTPPKRGTYYSATLRIKVRTALKKRMLLIVRYGYSDGRHPKGIAQSESWDILRAYTSRDPIKKPTKEASKPMKAAPVPIGR